MRGGFGRGLLLGEAAYIVASYQWFKSNFKFKLSMKHITVVAAVIEKNDKILCVQRGPNKYAYISEKWEFPGGKIEPDETEEQTLHREIWEELSMKISIGEKLMAVEHEYPDFRLTMHAYTCSTVDEPTLSEHRAYCWLPKEEFSELDWAAADLPIVDRMKSQHGRT